MPRATPKPCKHRGCPRVVRGAHYCETHADKNTANNYSGWERHNKGKSRHQRGYGSTWNKQRAVALKRDDYLCQNCLTEKRVIPADSVDHIVNKANGGTDELSNLVSLCTPCHKRKTQQESIRGRHHG